MRTTQRVGILLLTVLLLAGLFGCAKDKRDTAAAATAFDFTDTDGTLPRGWTVESYEGAYQTSLDNGVFGISTRVSDDCRLIRTVDVEPETHYVFSAMVRTEAVSDGQGATLSIDNYSLDGSYIYSDGVFGTTDWTPVTLAFRTAKGQERVVLALRLGGYSNVSAGSAWFRSVSLEQTNNAPVPFQNLIPSDQSASKTERSQEDFENVFTVIFWLGAIAAIVLLFGVCPHARTLSDTAEPLNTKELVFVLLVWIGLIVRFMLCAKFKGHSTDIGCWQGWGAMIARQGTHAFYVDNWCDYPPGYMLVCGVLWRVASLFENGPESLRLFVYMIPAFVCDVISGLLILKSAKRFQCSDRLALLLAGLIVLNPAAVFLSGAWGQIDSILTVLLLGCFLLLNNSREKPWLRFAAGILYAVAILMKWQALIFGPVLALMYVVTGIDQRGRGPFWKHLVWSIAAVLGALFVLLFAALLFLGDGMRLTWMIERFLSASGGYDYASVEAYNYFTLFGANWTKSSADVFRGANVIGMLTTCNELFTKVALLITFPTLVMRAWRTMRTAKAGESNTAFHDLIGASAVAGFLVALYFLFRLAGETGSKLGYILGAVAKFPVTGILSAWYLLRIALRECEGRSYREWLAEGNPAVVGGATMVVACCTFAGTFFYGALCKLLGATLTYRQLGITGIVLAAALTLFLYILYKRRHLKADESLYSNRGLIFLLAACFCVWVFTFGHYMHERYIFPALFLLIFAYAYDRDPHKLAAFGMLTVTTFMNEMTAMFVVSDGAIDLIRGGVIHNRMIALVSLLEVGAAMYLTATVFLKALAFDPRDPWGTENQCPELENTERR